jgi:Tol biopolymer transport system component
VPKARLLVPAAAALAAAAAACGSSSGAHRGLPLGPLRVAFAQPDSSELWVADASGRKRFRLWADTSNSNPAFSAPAWSPDGKRVAYWTGTRGDVLTLASAAGVQKRYEVYWSTGRVQRLVSVAAPRRALTPPLRGRAAPDLSVIDPPAPVWSADGSRLAYIGRDGNTRIVPVGGGRLWTVRTSRLLFSGSTTLRVALSPHGTRVAVTGPGRGSLVGEVATGRVWWFAPGGLDIEGGAAWSPDGRELVFARSDRRGNRQLRVARPDGSGLIELTNDVPRDPYAHFSNAEPVWSPDGTRIAFLSNRDGWNDWELLVVGADGRGERRLTRGVSVSLPLTWSPDSRRIAFRGWGYGGSLGVVDVDGSGLRRLARIPLDQDGAEVPFGFGWAGPAQPTAARAPRLLPPPAHPITAVRDHLPAGRERLVSIGTVATVGLGGSTFVLTDLSPDGRLAAFVRRNPSRAGFALGVVDTVTGAIRIVAHGAIPWEADAGGLFSADGRRLLYRKDAALAAVDLATGRVLPVTGWAGPARPEWLTDGRVAFVDALHRLVLARPGGPARRIGVRLRKPYAFALSPDGRWLVTIASCAARLTELATGETRTIGRDLVTAGEIWSPDGKRFVLARPLYADCEPPLGAHDGDAVLFDRVGLRIGSLLGLREDNVEQIQTDWSGDGHTLVLALAYGGTRPPPSPGYAYSTASGRVSRILRGWFWSAPLVAGPRGQVVFGRMVGRSPTLALESGRLAGR